VAVALLVVLGPVTPAPAGAPERVEHRDTTLVRTGEGTRRRGASSSRRTGT
jgi:hypothetical protein